MSQVMVMVSALGCSSVTTPVQGFSGSVPSHDLPLGPTTLVAFRGKEAMVWSVTVTAWLNLFITFSTVCRTWFVTMINF